VIRPHEKIVGILALVPASSKSLLGCRLVMYMGNGRKTGPPSSEADERLPRTCSGTWRRETATILFNTLGRDRTLIKPFQHAANQCFDLCRADHRWWCPSEFALAITHSMLLSAFSPLHVSLPFSSSTLSIQDPRTREDTY
jgi:hypothetical protein